MPVHLVTPRQREALKALISSLRESGRSVAGVLSSTGENGRKHVERLSTGETRLLQLNDITEEVKGRMAAFKGSRGTSEGESEFHSTFAQDLAKEYTQDVVTVGPFVFDSSVLAWAREELEGIEGGGSETLDWIIVDEIGPLEMKRRLGLEPAFSRMLAKKRPSQHIAVILRDNLRSAFGPHFDLPAEDIVELDLGAGANASL